jgi:3D (Asp-Asp-Asp) domain-containing protein
VLRSHESAHAQPAFDAAGSGQTVAWKPGESSPGRASGVDGAGARGAARPVRPHGLAVELTAYSASDEEGTAAGLTFTGVRARPGTVAVDPAVIPLGSRLRIAGLPGIYRAEDTGGGIRNAHVDVFMESRALALQFGRHRNVLVEILDQ